MSASLSSAGSSLAEKLEVWGFEEGTLIFKDFSLGAVLRLTPRDISCATDEELNTLHSATADFLNGLPVGLSIQFVQSVQKTGSEVLSQHQSGSVEGINPIVKSLLADRVARFSNLDVSGSMPSQNLYLVIRKPFEKPVLRKKRGLFAFFTKKAESDEMSPIQDNLSSELRYFGQTVSAIIEGLARLGVQSVQIREAQAFELLFDQWNPSFPLEGMNFNREDIRDDLLLSDLVLSIKGFSLGKVHHRVLSLKIMPDLTFSSMSERLRDLPLDSRLFLSVDVLNQDRETFALETQRRIAYAMYAGKKGVSDLESEAKLKDIESLLSKRVSGEEKIFGVSLNVVLRHESEEVLDEQVQKTLQIFRTLSGAEGMIESLAAGPVFLELSLPNGRARERARRMNTNVLADFLPIFGDWRGHESPRVLLRNRRGGLLGFDPFSPTLTNFNQIVSGGSGAGKSFMTNLVVSQLMKEDPKVFILDIGGSYRNIAQCLDGQYIPLGASSSFSLNPFDFGEQDEAGDSIALDPTELAERKDQKVKFLVSLVELMTKEDGANGIGKLERSEVEKTIQELLRDEESPCISHLRERLLKNEEPKLQRMGKILGPWCGDSPFGKFVDQKTNLELKKRIVCFDLKGLESQPDLQAVCLFLITDLIWREVQRDRTSIKLVVFDECWRLLESEAGSRFIGEVFRTFRKYKASAIAISQTVDDFARSKVASAILPNSSVKWILMQKAANLPLIQETLLLNERELKLVESITSKKGYFSEAFLIAGDDKQVVVVESTPLEYWLATTDSEDLKAMETARKEHPDLSNFDLLKYLARILPNGASAGSSGQ